MNSARAMLFLGPGKALEPYEYPVPDPEPGALLVKVTMTTICGSDMHTVSGRRPGGVPGILGHEISGRIIKLGKAVESDASGRKLRENDRVTWSIAASCGKCSYCTDWKLPQKCLHLFKYGHASSREWPHFNGGFAEIVYIRPGTTVLKVPDSISDAAVTPINCALATVMHGIEKMALRGGEQVVVMGAGMLGIYAAAVLRRRVCREVMVIDPDSRRLKTAEKFGGTPLIPENFSPDEIAAMVKNQTGGFGADAVLEVCGVPESIVAGMALLRNGGRLVTAGMVFPGAALRLDARLLTTKMISLSGIHNYRPDHLIEALRFVEENNDIYPFAELVGASFPLAAVNAALTAAANRRHIRVAVY
ncbi:MAG: zinc-binding dehydrogenase [Victivallales bacterium]|nr:zinc-binding dehydrogenase [Victivallales bacterium]